MQATTVQSPTPAPAVITVPESPNAPATVVVTGADGTTQFLPIPLTRAEVENIKDRRSELSDQLTSAAGRRRRLAEELVTAPPGAARAGIEGRLVVLDRRLAQLESDIAATGRQLTAAPAGLQTESFQPGGGDMPENVMIVINVFTVFVLFPLAFALARNLWKRGTRASAVPAPTADNSARMERLEQGVEAIAIEVERISEGQRFVTKLLSEASPAVKLAQGERVAEKAGA